MTTLVPDALRTPSWTSHRFVSLMQMLDRQGRDSFDKHDLAVRIMVEAKRARRTVFFIGNGGSAAIASHMAADFLKNGGIAAQCFTDGPLTTCLANDLGYEQVYARPIAMHARPGDVLVAISSSGRSPNIISAVDAALKLDLQVIGLSGFDEDNPLRSKSDVDFYVPSHRYGLVEVCHHAICHAILDAVIGA